jgi:hypothetical protein
MNRTLVEFSTFPTSSSFHCVSPTIILINIVILYEVMYVHFI